MIFKPIISVVTLTKNDNQGFKLTANSLFEQDFSENIEWVIIDGSSLKNFKFNKTIIDRLLLIYKNKISFELNIYHINAFKQKISGIYNCMNLGLSKTTGRSIIFMNGGDEFYNKDSIKILSKANKINNFVSTVSFGQANIISNLGINWNFPGSQLSKISLWLKFFEPNHQSMLVTSDIAKNIKFMASCKISADKFWKRNVIANAHNVIYLRKPVCRFKLDGSSSKRPNFKILKEEFKDKEISILRKLIVLIRFLIVPFFYKYLPYLQKYKSKLIDFIF